MLSVVALSGSLLFGATACGGSDSAPAEGETLTVAVDTLGDTIVVRTAGDVPLAEELQLTELWRVGDPDGDETTSFGRVHSLAVTENNELYVFEASVPQLRHYAADGSLIGVLGGKGSGPGEYTSSNGLAVLTDGRVALWDAGNSRLNLYAADDSYLTQWMPPVQNFGTGSNVVFALADGGLALGAFVRDSSLTREALGRTAWFLFDSNGTIRDTVLAPFFGDPPVNLIARREGSSNSRSVPFMPAPQTALDRNGAVMGGPGAPYVVHLSRGGRPVRIVREVAAHEVDAAELEQTRALVTWQMLRNQPDWSWNGPDMPSEKPPVQDVAPALDDQLLVQVSAPSEPFEPEPARIVEGETPRPTVAFRTPLVFELFGTDGSFRGRFRIPYGAKLHALRGTDAWGTVVDELDIPYLVRWRLNAPTAPQD